MTDIESDSVSPPRRFIYSMSDMDHFIHSPAKRDLLSFVTALGRSTTATSSSYTYDSANPLVGLSPGMASLHGSLRAISSQWLKDLPPDDKVKARFGNPMFKEWHARLVARSRYIIQSVMKCHIEHVVESQTQMAEWDMDILEKCSQTGYDAALTNTTTEEKKDEPDSNADNDNTKEDKIIVELQSYLHPAFGHEIRLDYGTGHESSFFVFLYCLCKIGVFGNVPKTAAPSNDLMAPVALSITIQYLEVCRGIQTDYMLEPAGSHGVWGLDDYHCIPFYIGACQLQNVAYQNDDYTPLSINRDTLLHSTVSDSILYFQCIRYIKSLKKGVPFFESSPMLDDISRLANWHKVSGGLLRLYEGEVLDKKPVVQHFVFGDIFKATWKATASTREAPTRTFNSDINHVGVESVAPWALQRPAGGGGPGSGSAIPPTKAPWAK